MLLPDFALEQIYRDLQQLKLKFIADIFEVAHEADLH